jgi:hypothetical protein
LINATVEAFDCGDTFDDELIRWMKRGGSSNLEAETQIKAQPIQVTQQTWSPVDFGGVGYNHCNRPSRKTMQGIL